jgi:signal transduction histidine kinase
MSDSERDRGVLFGLSLSMQFMAAAALVLCVSMALLGTWVNQQITRSVLASSGAGAVAFLSAFVEPWFEDFETQDELPLHVHETLDTLLAVGKPLLRSVVSVKIWRPDGTVLYANEPKSLIGKTFLSSDVARAAAGEVVAEFEDMRSEESAHEQMLDMSLIEVYAPLRAASGNVVAVGEIYENATALDAQLEVSEFRTWIFVCFTTLVMLAFLYLIVRRGNRLIALQRSELQQRFRESVAMAKVNEDLRLQADKARLDANASNEELIGRIGLDLHDGPIQLLSLLMLRLGRLRHGKLTPDDETYAASIQELTSSVIQELRSLSAGLALPEIREIALADAIRLAAERHENLTGTDVAVELGELPDETSIALKICIYRIIQESLNNSFKHAGAKGQRVSAHQYGRGIILTVADTGDGQKEDGKPEGDGAKLGLRGIRNRVATFGGELNIRSDESGTVVTVELPLTEFTRIASPAENFG